MTAKPRIVLTGATGLVGGAVFRRLATENLPALLLVRDPLVFNSTQQLSTCHAIQFTLEENDQGIAQEIMDFRPDFVIHCAWIGTENTNRNQPEFIYSNLQSCLRLMDICAKAGCKNWIGFGSQAEYSPHIPIRITEDMPTFPDTAYGLGKLAACHMLSAAADSLGVGFTWLRLYTCYGRGHKPGYIIPHLISQLRNNTVPEIKTPNAVWDCLHAEDAADAVITMLKNNAHKGIYNLAYGQGVSVGDIALTIADLLNFTKLNALRAQIESSTDMPFYRVADTQKFSHAFGWMPKLDIRSGLKKCL